MILSEIQISLIKQTDGLIGFASLVIDNQIYLSSIGIHKKLSSAGYRLTYPKKNGFDLFYPITAQASQFIETAIFEKLEDVMKKARDDRYNHYEYSNR